MSVIISFACISLGANACFEKGGDSKTLRFNNDGSFKILQVSDIQDTPYMAPIIADYLESICKSEKPDLIVLTGDNIGKSCGKAATQEIAELQVIKGIDAFMSVFQKLNIPVAAVFGNHDSENRVAKETQMKDYSRYSCFVGYDADSSLDGCGTYNLPILSSSSDKVAYNLWMLDSNMYDGDGYDNVHQNQVDWYVKKSNELKAANGGVPVDSMAFQHIIVNEIYDAVNTGVLKSGGVNETPNASAKRSSEFSAMLNQGDVRAMFFGHDHENTFTIGYKGIDLVATPAAGFTLSSDNRGVRVITINEKDTSTYSSHVINYKETFCTDKLSTMRYLMNAADQGENVQRKNTISYFFLAQLHGVSFFKVVYEIICTVM